MLSFKIAHLYNPKGCCITLRNGDRLVVKSVSKLEEKFIQKFCEKISEEEKTLNTREDVLSMVASFAKDFQEKNTLQKEFF